MKTVLMIAGMRDNTCRQRIAAALESVAGVTEVDVNLYRARAMIKYRAPCEPALLKRTIQESGYVADFAGDNSLN